MLSADITGEQRICHAGSECWSISRGFCPAAAAGDRGGGLASLPTAAPHLRLRSRRAARGICSKRMQRAPQALKQGTYTFLMAYLSTQNIFSALIELRLGFSDHQMLIICKEFLMTFPFFPMYTLI